MAPSEALISGFATTEQELMWWFEPIGSCLSSITNSSPPDDLIIFPTLTASIEKSVVMAQMASIEDLMLIFKSE